MVVVSSRGRRDVSVVTPARRRYGARHRRTGENDPWQRHEVHARDDDDEVHARDDDDDDVGRRRRRRVTVLSLDRDTAME